jgi:TP901 family phage tail tape measure protein
MAKPFNLTVALNLQGPNNVKKVVADIRRQLTGIKAEVKLDIQADSAKNIAKINKQLNSLSSTAKAANVNVTTLSRSLSSLSTSFNQSASNAKQFNAATEKTAKSVKKGAKDLQVATTAVEEFGKQSALAVKRFAAFSIVTSIINRFSSAISDSLSDFIEFDRQLVRVAQVTKGTQSELSALSQEIGRLASNFGVASKDLAEVSVTLSQAGLTAAQTKTALEALAKTSLAATFNDINSTTEGSIALMRQFRIGVQDLESALGSINAVAGQFAVESSDIITAISRAGGVFASASKGVSEGKDALNEFVAVFTSVRATTRESAETIATGLRTIFTRIQRGSTIKFLREFGVELQDSQGKFVGAYEAIRRLSEGLGQLDPRDVRFTKIVEELGGFRQIGKVIPLIQQFTTAQEALGVAQRGAGSLTQDAIKAQQSLAVQFQQTREQFAALIREIGQSATFQTITKLVLGLANAFIKVAGSLKPILPLLTGLTAIKGFKFITEFISGFKGGLGGAGIGGIGKTIGGALGGGEGDGGGGGGKKTQAIESNTAALGSNTTALSSLTTAVSQLNASLDGTNTAIQNLINVASRTDSSSTSGGGGGILGPDGKPIGFASGGMVPGSGNRDTVKAMLTPGEFVIRKKAVESIGVDNLAKMNKYAYGGKVKSAEEFEGYNITTVDLKDKRRGLTKALGATARGSLLGNMFEGFLYKKFGIRSQDQKFPDVPNVRNNPKAMSAVGDQLADGIEHVEFKYKKELADKAKYDNEFTDKNTAVFSAFKAGGSVEDTVPAMLTPGEFVLNKKAAQKLGGVTLNRLNNADKIQGFNKGGAVGFINGGQVTAADGSVFTPGGGEVDETLSKAIDRLDANLKGLGSIIRETIVATDSDVSTQAQIVERLEDAIRAVNKARAGGEATEIAVEEEILKDEIRYMTEGLAEFKKRFNLGAGGRPNRPGGLGYPGSMQQAPVKTGGLGYPGSMVTKPGGFNATTKQTSKLTIAFQKLTEKIDAVSNVTGSFVGTFSAGLSSALPQIDSLVENLDRLNQTTVSTSAEFMAFRGALEQGASQGLSASIAAQQAGFGRRGAAVIGGLGFAGGAVSGAISGATTARAAEFQQQAAAANVSRDRALQDFEDASSAEQRRQALKELTKANADAANATEKANAELNSELAQAGRQVGLFSNALIQGVSALALLNSFRGGRGGRRKGFAKGGVVYASKGTFVNYQPKGTDTIPAMLSPGEFVVNARSTSKNRGVLEAINKNKGGFISGGVQYLQAGGSPTVSGDIESSADNMAASMEKAASAIEKAGQQTEQSSSTFGKAMSTAGDVLTMTSDSTAVNVASFAAQSAVAGAVPYAGAALDYSSAAVNYQRGNYVDAGVDALFGTIDLITDTIQGIGYLTGVGAPVAAAGGAGAQVAADATQAGIKQGLKNFGPAIVKQTKEAFGSVAKYGKNAFESIKDYGGTALAAGGTLLGGLFAFGRKKGGRKAAGAIDPKTQAMIGSGLISAESVKGTTKASRKAKTTTGGGRAGRRGGGLANFLTNAGFFAAAAAPGLIEGMSADPEVIAREQAASQERYKNTADAAIKRGQVARLSSPVAGREISELQQLRAQGLSQSQIRQRMGASAIAAGDRSGGFTQEQRRQEALAAQGFDVKAGQTVEEFISGLDATDQSAARAAIEASDFALQLDALTAARQKELAKLQPGTAAYEEMSKEIDNEIKATKERGSISKKQIPIINEQIGATDMAAASAAELALKMAQFAKQTADLTAVMTRLSAGMKRISDDIGNVVAQTTVLTNAYSGQADAASAAAASSATMDAQVLGNLSAYSGAELEDTLGRVTQGLGGGPQITQAADLVRAQQILEKQRPTLEAAVKSTEGEGPAATQEAIEGVLLKAFENVPFADPNIGKQFAQEAARSIAEGGGDAGKNLEAFLAKSAQATKLFEQYTKMASEGLKQLAAQSDKLTQTYQKINQLQGEQAALTAQSTADLKQALGFKLTPGEATAASQARIRTLTGGPTDPTEIFNQLNKNIQERQSRIEDARAEGPQAEANLYADPGFADLNAAINQSRQALEMLANDTTAADAALQRIAERDKQLRAQADTALDFAADPTKALEFIGQAQSMSRVLSGRGGQMDVGAGQALLGRLEGMLPQEQSDALRQRFFQGTGASLGLQNELAPFAAGVATDVEGKKQDPIIAREIKAYEEANKVRQEAYNKLIELEQRSATALEGSLTEINSQLTQRLAPLVNDINAELEKLKQGLQAANNGNAPQPNAGANGAPPPPQAAPQVAAPATPPPAVAGTQAPPAAEEVAAAAAGIQQAQATSQTVEFGGSTQVVVSFNPDDLGQLQGMREGLQRDISQSIASALKEATGGKINLNLPGIA